MYIINHQTKAALKSHNWTIDHRLVFVSKLPAINFAIQCPWQLKKWFSKTISGNSHNLIYVKPDRYGSVNLTSCQNLHTNPLILVLQRLLPLRQFDRTLRRSFLYVLCARRYLMNYLPCTQRPTFDSHNAKMLLL